MAARLKLVVGIIALSAAAAGCSSLPFRREPPTPPMTIANPQWTSTPTNANIQQIYPLEARRIGTPGRATIQCVVQEEGGLRPCTVTSETPAKMGFGEAALKAAPFYQMKTETPDGRPTRGALVNVTVDFTPGPA